MIALVSVLVTEANGNVLVNNTVDVNYSNESDFVEVTKANFDYTCENFPECNVTFCFRTEGSESDTVFEKP
jgi:hypothetical protein